MSYRSHAAAPSRVFDHLYDPIFTTSDPKNVYKENCIALTRSAPIRVYPVYDSMFSELSYEERNSYAYQKNILPNYSSYNTFQNERFISVTGADRSKFFCNPISNTRTINVGLMANKGNESSDEMYRKFRNTSMQTLYRESSAQTRSWLPECYSEEITNDVPEVVYVADIIESVSCPGLKEVEIIERARKRRKWELSLPPIIAADEIPTRVAALEAFEWEEWIAREKDINEYQQARLRVVTDLIEKREIKHKSNTDLKIQNIKKKASIERSRQKGLLINKFQRCMRKIDLAKRKESMKNLENDPILVHYDKKSNYTLPKIQLKMSKTKKRAEIEYSDEFKKRFSSLEQNVVVPDGIQNYLKPNKPELWIPKKSSKEIERGIWNESYLKRLHETLKQFRRKKFSKRKFTDKHHLKENESILTTLPVQASDDHDDKNYQDNIFVQKTIKGRAIQSMLQKGMKKIHDVIQEAKETHSIAAVRKLFPKEFTQQIDCQEEIMREYKQIEDILKNDIKLKDELMKIESKDVGNLLDYFGRELTRLQSEKQAHALYLLAERERYRREAENLGGTNCEEQFKNDSMTLYLENILLEGINRAFDENSRSIIREMAQKIDSRASRTIKFDDIVEEFSVKSRIEEEDFEKVSEASHREVVTELLKNNMIPNILYELKNEKLFSRQQEYLEDAHYFLYTEEFEQAMMEEEKKFCVTIIDEILDNALIENFHHKKEVILSQEYLDAEQMASHIVEEILNDILNHELKEQTEELYDNLKTKRDSNSKSTSETESSDDLLARIITHEVFNDVLECNTSSASEISETNNFY